MSDPTEPHDVSEAEAYESLEKRFDVLNERVELHSQMLGQLIAMAEEIKKFMNDVNHILQREHDNDTARKIGK
jgi:dephospho-CoA kinase